MTKVENWKNMSLCSLEGEVWKDVPGFEGEYQASSLGRIKSLQRDVFFIRNGKTAKRRIEEKIKAQNPIWKGYLRLSIIENNRKCSKFAHRFVALAFHQNLDNKPEVNHKDGNIKNNVPENLEWVTKSENAIHCFRTLKRKTSTGMKNKFGALHHKSKKVLCLNDNKIYGSALEASRLTRVSAKIIWDQCKGQVVKSRKTDLIFKYI